MERFENEGERNTENATLNFLILVDDERTLITMMVVMNTVKW